MRRWFHRRWLWILLLAVLLTLGIAALTHSLDGRANSLTEAVQFVTEPVERAATAVRGQVAAVQAFFVSRESLQTENEQLRRTIAELQDKVRTGTAATQENDRLRRLLDFREKHRDLTLEPARVRDRCSDNWTAALTIDKGSRQGVKVRDCVVDASGALLGVVGEVGESWATVLAVVDASVEWGGEVLRTGETAVLEGDFALMPEGRLKLSYLSKESDILIGDEILTFASEGVYPSGLPVGIVEELHDEESGMSRYAILKPEADWRAETQVFVIKAFDIVD